MTAEKERTGNFDFEYVIIGAGAAGCYTAWRLTTEGDVPSSAIAVYEMNSRIGGRIYSETLPGLGGVRPAELGAMRFLNSQPIITNLVKHLNFEIVTFEVDSKNNIYFLRDRHLRVADFFDPEKVPYDLKFNERGMLPGDLMIYALNSLVPDAAYLSLEEWMEVKKNFKVDGENLYNLGFWNLVQRVISQEGHHFVQDAYGYDTTVLNWNAADAIPWFVWDFPAGVKFISIREGLQALLEKMLGEAQKKGAHFEKEARMIKWEFLEERKDSGFRLHFENENQKPVTTKNLILALPRRAIELLDMPALSLEMRKALASVTPQPLFKLFQGYSCPWYRPLGLKAGRTITDLPLRQVYYWGSNYDRFRKIDFEAETGGRKNSPENSMIMVSYSDGSRNNFWGSFLEQISEKQEGLIENLEPLRGKVSNFISEVEEELRAIHDLTYIPKPYTLAYANWDKDPFAGGWHTWKVGVKSWELSQKIRRPYPGYSVFICGEAYSDLQGWIEGAFLSAEQLLEKEFGLSRPEWLPEDKKLLGIDVV